MISPVDLHNAQRNDHNKKDKWFFNLKAAIIEMKDRLDESKTMRRLMNEWKSLELCEDEILPRRAGEYLQLVQPKEFHRTMNCIKRWFI